MKVTTAERKIIDHTEREIRSSAYVKFFEIIIGCAALYLSYSALMNWEQPLDFPMKLGFSLLFSFGFATLIRVRLNWKNAKSKLVIKLASEFGDSAA